MTLAKRPPFVIFNMLHVPLDIVIIESVFAVGGDPLWMSTVTNNVIPVWDVFGHKSGRLFNSSI